MLLLTQKIKILRIKKILVERNQMNILIMKFYLLEVIRIGIKEKQEERKKEDNIK
jgi:hypothetical protein